MAVSPASPAGFVLAGEILRVIDQHIRAGCQFAHVLVEDGVSGLVIGGIHEHPVLGFEPKPHATLGMVEPGGLHHHVVEREAALVEVIKLALRLHLHQADREEGRSHLLLHHALQAAGAAGTVEQEAIGPLIQRAEERESLDMVPVKVGDEDVRENFAAYELLAELLAESAESGPAIEDIKVVAESNLDTGGIASVAQVF